MSPRPTSRRLVPLLCVCLLASLLPRAGRAAGFANQARVEITDPSGGLSWSTNGAGLSVSCWFKISVPSGMTITENMTVLVNRRTGSQSDPYSYLIQYNVARGVVEFACKGTIGSLTNTLIDTPYLDRWYHVAVVRQQDAFTAYVDGRQVFETSGSVGNSANTDGVSVGGWGNSKYFFGEVQEVAIYQTALSQDFIVQYMYTDQPAIPELRGYYKLGYSAHPTDLYANFAPPPVPTGTENAAKQGAGNVTFEEASQAGEQSAFDSHKNGGLDALVPLSGAFSWEQTALSRPTPGMTFELRFGYSSANTFAGAELGGIDPYASGPLGKGWRHIFETRLIPAQTFSPLADTDTVGLMLWNGSIVTWDLDYSSGKYFPRDGEYKGELLLTATNWQWISPERLVYVFKRPDSGSAVMRGRLTAIRDFNQNSVQVLHNQATGVITQVVDTVSGRYNFAYSGGLLTNISFNSWQLNFTYDTTNRLVSKTLTNTSGLYTAVNTTWRFTYGTNGLLERIRDPRGNTSTLVRYDQFGRKNSETDALGRANTYAYGSPGNRYITRTDPEGFQWSDLYDRRGRPIEGRDPLGNVTKTAYGSVGKVSTITDPLGYNTYLAYDDRGNMVSNTNALGEVRQWVCHPYFNKAVQEITPQPADVNGNLTWTNFFDLDATTGNLLRHYDALGNLVAYSYTTNGLVDTQTDGNGNVTRSRFDSNGFIVALTDAASNTTTYARNDLGWPLAQTNALGQVTTFTYDLNGKVVRRVDPLNRSFISHFDENGNLMEQYDAKGQLTRYAYDVANQRTQMVDRAGAVWNYSFTLRGKPFTATDPLGNTATNIYDAAAQNVRTLYPLGLSSQAQFDSLGRVTNAIDRAGQSWQTVFDPLSRQVANIDPLGDTKRTDYDVAGRVQKITTPNGYASFHTYDGRGRLTKWVDPEGYEWRYAYDGVGNITKVTDALGGHYAMAYGPRNERLLEHNQDGFEWHYAYDELARSKAQTDPNGTTKTLSYDPGGRVLAATFNSGRVNSFTYDDNDNPQTASRTGSGPTTTSQLTYDALDRVQTCTDTFGKAIYYRYDPAGRMASTTYPDGKVLTNRFDALGRLTNNIFTFSGQTSFSMSFGYDAADRLLWRVYPNGVVQSNSLDNAGKVVRLSHSPPTLSSNCVNIALQYAYDRNGNKVGSSESGTLTWPMPTLGAESARYTPAGRLIDRQITPQATSPQPSTLNYSYDPSGNMTNAVGGGQSFSLAYDEDNRVTSLLWDCNLTSVFITNRYDAFGRRVSKTADGVESRYVLDLAGSMERVLCDVSSSGQITAWYVHAPDLAYRVGPDASLLCYHADAMANVIATSDGLKVTSSLYAYTPYGRSLGETNTATGRMSGIASNPYRFVGSLGVMEELPNVFFMRARYYSAEAAVFLSVEPLRPMGAGRPLYAYGYGSANPLSNVDPNGLTVWNLGLVVSGSAAAGVGGEASYSNGVLFSPNAFVEGDWDHAFGLYQSSVRSVTVGAGGGVSRGIEAGVNWAQDRVTTAFDTGWTAGGSVKDMMGGSLDLLGKGGDVEGISGSWQFGPKVETQFHFGKTSTQSRSLGDIFGSKAQSPRSSLAASAKPAAAASGLPGTTREALQTKTTQAAKYAQAQNGRQATLPASATAAINIGANIIGSYVGSIAGNAAGRLLPKNTSPLVRTAVQTVVSYVVATVVTSVVTQVLTAIVTAIVVGVPKRLIVLMLFVFGLPALHYGLHQFRRRRQSLAPPLGICSLRRA